MKLRCAICGDTGWTSTFRGVHANKGMRLRLPLPAWLSLPAQLTCRQGLPDLQVISKGPFSAYAHAQLRHGYAMLCTSLSTWALEIPAP